MLNKKIANTKFMPDNYMELTEKLPADMQALITIGANTGMPMKSAARLTINDFMADPKDETLVVCRYTIEDKRAKDQTQYREHVIPDLEYIQYIKPYIDQLRQENKEHLFPNLDRRKVNKLIKKTYGKNCSYISCQKCFPAKVNGAIENMGSSLPMPRNIFLFFYLLHQMNIAKIKSLIPYLFQEYDHCVEFWEDLEEIAFIFEEENPLNPMFNSLLKFKSI